MVTTPMISCDCCCDGSILPETEATAASHVNSCYCCFFSLASVKDLSRSFDSAGPSMLSESRKTLRLRSTLNPQPEILILNPEPEKSMVLIQANRDLLLEHALQNLGACGRKPRTIDAV